jgi:type I restriction enzyme R subunit
MDKTFERRIGDPERITQNRVIDILTTKEMGYTYIGYWKKRENNSNVEKEYVLKFLKRQGYSDELIRKAINYLESAAKLGMGNTSDDKLYTANKDFYSLLRYGTSFKIEGKSQNQHVSYIDWDNIKNNDFYIAEEVTYVGCHEKRPDVVIYVNGIALAVLELKSSIVDVAEGIRQNITNQRSAITQFFTTVQFVMAGNESQGLRYGTTLTPEKYFLSWKEYNYDTKESKRIPFFEEIKALFNKERFLDMILNFVVFDCGKKKLCRPNQYFGVKCAQKFIQNNEGGIIWHTQGSGKSLSMVWLAKWIKEFYPDGRVLLITDRIELDEQIEGVFAGVDETIIRTKSGGELLKKLNRTEDRLICSLVHKFGKYSNEDDDNSKEYIDDLTKHIPSDFKPKGKIIVFVDECHRTQSGKLHKAMKKLLPNALFIGFTGTPLLKKDKKTSLETFGRYIHCYKFDEAVKDEVVLDLRYEARDVPQKITQQDKIDEWFEYKTRGLNDIAKANLKKMWGNMQTLLSSQSRLEKIAADIIFDFTRIPRLAEGRGNAMLVASSILEACRYWKIFQSKGFKKCAVVTSYSPYHSDVRTEDTGEDAETKMQEQYNTYLEMLGISPDTPNKDKLAEQYEDRVKEQFRKEPANMKLLIVVDKLLTGFDAPPATYLYIDKKMQDHGLFQAVCRVNRLDGEEKDYGYIVDYMDLFQCLEKSIIDYTTEALGGFEKEDVVGLLNDRKQLARKDFDNAMDSIAGLLEGVKEPKSDDDYRAYFHCFEEVVSEAAIRKRYQLYKAVNAVIRTYTNFLPYMSDIEVGYSTEEAEKFAEKIKSYIRLKEMIMLSSGDSIDFKAYEADMRFMIDNYIEADASRKLCDFEGMSLVELVVDEGEKFVEKLPDSIKNDGKSVAEMIENHIRRVVNYEYQTNPEYYEKMSKILDNLIDQRKQDKISYAEYLQQVSDLSRKVKQIGVLDYPTSIAKHKELRALYDNLGKNEELAKKLHQDILTNKPHNYKDNSMKIRKVKQIIKETLGTDDAEEIERIYKIVEQNYD